jgi:hypothetical protein
LSATYTSNAHGGNWNDDIVNTWSQGAGEGANTGAAGTGIAASGRKPSSIAAMLRAQGGSSKGVTSGSQRCGANLGANGGELPLLCRIQRWDRIWRIGLHILVLKQAGALDAAPEHQAASRRDLAELEEWDQERI